MHSSSIKGLHKSFTNNRQVLFRLVHVVQSLNKVIMVLESGLLILLLTIKVNRVPHVIKFLCEYKNLWLLLILIVKHFVIHHACDFIGHMISAKNQKLVIVVWHLNDTCLVDIAHFLNLIRQVQMELLPHTTHDVVLLNIVWDIHFNYWRLSSENVNESFFET